MSAVFSVAAYQERIAVLEEEALADKDWFLRGEADATRRPLNSALEIDMDFDTTGVRYKGGVGAGGRVGGSRTIKSLSHRKQCRGMPTWVRYFN